MAIEHLIHTTVGVELVRKLSSDGVRIFTAEEARRLAPSVGLSSSYFRQAMYHLVRSGWIARLKKGLYALSGAVPGTTSLHEFEIAMALVQPAAVSHWSALSHHGLTDQVPRRVFVLTTARSVPRRRGVKPKGVETGYRVGETVYQFVQVKPERFFGVEDVWVNESRIKITDQERTLLDGLMAPQHCGDFAEVLHAFEVRAPKLDVERIIGYALKLDAATAKRLGWILERQGMAPERLAALRQLPIKGYRVLDPTGPRHGPHEARWMIQVNLPGTEQP
ncbi:MAG: type IV toxin-antitoxin system AbiEi family antitoxin domain-containing protein [Candidatus Omnitrophota bacterium]|nr:type IV toxin-antitoxin system AbiEi family antitoxin domain-containing protein [Candidatus Omnitrophota bacterium]